MRYSGEHWRWKKRIIDLTLLPPCRMSLHLCIRRSNYIARIWRQAETDMMELENPKDHGWNDDFSLQWPEDVFPTDVMRQLDDEITKESDYDTDSDDEVDLDEDEDDDYGVDNKWFMVLNYLLLWFNFWYFRC